LLEAFFMAKIEFRQDVVVQQLANSADIYIKIKFMNNKLKPNKKAFRHHQLGGPSPQQ
jgi:hypothetical protein